MNKEIEAQYDAILNLSTLTDLRKLEDDLLMTRMLLINYHNICINLKQALNDIREYIYKNSISMDLLSIPPIEKLDFKGDVKDILQIIDKVGGNE